MTSFKAWGATAADSGIGEFPIERRALRPDDVEIDIRYCGICHTDLHYVRNDWGNSVYPLVPGHEMTGVVRSVGEAVSRYKAGDSVAVGCMVDSCKACPRCDAGEEQYCDRGNVSTYNGVDRVDGSRTMGGYSTRIVVRQDFVLSLPDTLDMARAGPLLCAGITSWAPLRAHRVGPGSKVGIVGLGGLGHMGVKLAAALGAEVTMITTSPTKAEDARGLGALDVLISTDPAAMEAARERFDFILDTVPVDHEVAPYLDLLAPGGNLVMVGTGAPVSFFAGLLIGRRRGISGSMIGGIAETQQLLEFCAEHQILPDCEMIAPAEIDAAYERMERSDVKYRFVIDIAGSQSS